jgi:hypothetical protein
MPRSSTSVAALACALAKAQAELVNPEKNMTATIRAPRAGSAGAQEERTFRYASLASGLDIVRKTLGKHEIATLQTTTVDNAVGMVQLTTTLAHSSGEWIASDWPVCPTAETANPQRMGAALTYARRYGLFTLVGIAGDDDLDAPDLISHTSLKAPAITAPPASTPQGDGRSPGRLNGRKPHFAPPERQILPPQDSARLRDAMLADIASLSAESAPAWATRMLPSKNTLIANDAIMVERAFEAHATSLHEEAVAATSSGGTATPVADASEKTELEGAAVPKIVGDSSDSASQSSIDLAQAAAAAIQPLAKTVRHRNKAHLKFVSTCPCLICGRQPSDPHHLRFVQPRAMGRKVSDEYTVPLCRTHHREVHRISREKNWWQSKGIAPLAVAEALWQASIKAGAPDRVESWDGGRRAVASRSTLNVS